MKTKRLLIIFAILPLCAFAQQSRLTLNLNNKGIAISPTHYGLFFEDINHAADGGLYAELIRNRSFEDAATPENWSTIKNGYAVISTSLFSTDLLNSAQTKSLQLTISKASATSRAGVCNTGFWGINVVDGREYSLSFYAKSGINTQKYNGSVTASLENATGTIQYSKVSLPGITSEWKKYTCKMTATGNDPSARFVLSFDTAGVIFIDVVSLFPPTFKNRENGLRPDLANLLVDLKSKFVRFPGGCFVEGDFLANRFQWKKTIGPIEERPGHYNLWGYRTSDGMGYHEFLQLCEDLEAKALFVINVGISHGDALPVESLNEYLKDALDAIEYANGASTSTFGALRAANGHPAPFNLKYIEVGNENYFSRYYAPAYLKFYNTIKTAYPEIQIIGNVAAWGTDSPVWDLGHPVDILDEHYYRNPQWFINQYNKYDKYKRSGSKIYVGEYAVTSGCGLGNLDAAVGEAVYMAGMENNSDIVTMNSYAPVFVNVNDRKWSPDLINYNASKVYCTPSYYVQKMFANNIGTVLIPVTDSSNTNPTYISGKVGLGTWNTLADFDDVTVKNNVGTNLFSDAFANGSNWTGTSGTWAATGGIYSQTKNAEDCRSIGIKTISDSVYTYSLRARKNSGGEGFLIMFGYKDSNNFYWWNIGGWGNTQHVIERCVAGTKSTLSSVPGSISSNQWYNIRIEVTAITVKCYLNDVLIQEIQTGIRMLYSTASLDENTNDLFIKVINPNNIDASTTIDLNGLTFNSVQGTLTELSSSNIADENTLAVPNKVKPVTSPITVNALNFRHTFKANSINIFKLDISHGVGIKSKPTSQIKMIVYPNPVKDWIHIDGNQTDFVNAEILNLSGQIFLKKKLITKEGMNISSLMPGMYILKLERKGLTESSSFIKE